MIHLPFILFVVVLVLIVLDLTVKLKKERRK